MPSLTKEDIIKVEDLPKEKIEVPEWGGYIFIRSLTARERDQFEFDTYEQMNKGAAKNMRSRLVCLCAVDDNGRNIFTLKDMPQLENKSGIVMDRLFDAAKKLSGLTYEEVEEEAKK